jgi:hypothetical protein
MIKEKEMGWSCSRNSRKQIGVHMHIEENNIKIDGMEVEEEPVDFVHLLHYLE